MNDDEVIQYWKNQWNEHMTSVKEYFKVRPNDLLIFDIETETHKLNDFFSKYIEIKKTEFGNHNKTKKLC